MVRAKAVAGRSECVRLKLLGAISLVIPPLNQTFLTLILVALILSVLVLSC